MTKKQWTTALSVGDDAIDDDHKDLFKLVHEFEVADLTDHSVSEALSHLEHYAEGHFAREEEHMRKMGYPDLEAHIQEHKMFVEWVDTVRHAYARSPASIYYVGEQVNAFLNRWLTDHIMNVDKRYAEFAAQKADA